MDPSHAEMIAWLWVFVRRVTPAVLRLPQMAQLMWSLSQTYGRSLWLQKGSMEGLISSWNERFAETRLDRKAGYYRDLPQLTWNGNLYTPFNLMALGFGHYGMTTIEQSKKRAISPLQAILKHALNQ